METKIEKLRQLVEVQKNSVSDEYMRGMANGLIVALAIFDEQEPVFVEPKASSVLGS